MLALGHDRLSRVQDSASSNSLNYAEHILQPLKEYLIKRGERLFREDERNKMRSTSELTDRDKVELAMEEIFKEDRDEWP